MFCDSVEKLSPRILLFPVFFCSLEIRERGEEEVGRENLHTWEIEFMLIKANIRKYIYQRCLKASTVKV
jgi:hypothetical protein